MHQTRSDSSRSSPEKIFTGVQFALFGFDSVSEAQYRLDLVSRGGTDVGLYVSSCTHVIVSGIVYDDPICIAARNGGKSLVTELWIDDTLDFGTKADASRVLYRPVKDLNGIPGSESLYICLTGYQRQERDDIMKTVSLMGAQFSKPLIANQVTHLICYKFEGEKYELAKKVNIKLVNHRWLEDCLKAWEILPIDNYTKSTWDLEILGAEARDTEEETEESGMSSVRKESLLGAPSLQGGMPTSVASDLSIPTLEKCNTQRDTVAEKQSRGSEQNIKNNGVFSNPCLETSSVQSLGMCGLNDKALAEFDHQDAGITKQAGDDRVITDIASADNIKKEIKESSTLSVTVKKCPPLSNAVDEKFSNLSYSRKNQRKLISEEVPSNILTISPQGNLVDNISKIDYDISQVELGEARSNHESAVIQCRTASLSVDHSEASSMLPKKRRKSVSRLNVKSPKLEIQNSKTSATQRDLSPSSTARSEQLETTTDINNLKAIKQADPSKFIPLSYKRRSVKSGKPASSTTNGTDTPVMKKADMPSDAWPRQALVEPMSIINQSSSFEYRTTVDVSPCDGKVLNEPKLATDVQESIGNTTSIFGTLAIDCRCTDGASPEEKLESSLDGSRKSEVSNKFIDGGYTTMYDVVNITTEEPGQTRRLQQDEGVVSPEISDQEARKLSRNASADIPNENDEKTVAGLHTRKVVAKRNSSSKKQSGGNFRKDKSFACADKTVTPNQDAVQSRKVGRVLAEQGIEREISNKKNEVVEPVSDDAVMEDKVKVAIDCMDSSMDSEKENKPNENGSLTMNVNSHRNTKLVPKHGKISMQSSRSIAADNKNEMQTSSCDRGARSEPAWFILSGHRLQRKEFQMVIKQLKGRLCRDSHNWSYQATHLIVPGPVRRTEKFFAAAAAGRWILKTEYLTASDESGKFPDEESFEWYKNGLSEDGAISLEAPRKWRLLRERTGHGALYGMRIVIYGDCIAPTLDTLKRVAKAGDGTVLATSPPYTRFLESGADYAIVSPMMPRVDSWVQEFLRHEIPCVLAEYLVEYVCKPGYSLERHVLYGTHAWADRSFASLLGRSEEIVTDASERH